MGICWIYNNTNNSLKSYQLLLLLFLWDFIAHVSQEKNNCFHYIKYIILLSPWCYYKKYKVTSTHNRACSSLQRTPFALLYFVFVNDALVKVTFGTVQCIKIIPQISNQYWLYHKIGASTWATTIGASMFIGLAGSAAATGMGVVMFEWHVSSQSNEKEVLFSMVAYFCFYCWLRYGDIWRVVARYMQ